MQSVGHSGIKTIHRLVVLPDYQGIGIATNLLNYVGSLYAKENYQVNIVTSNPSIYNALKRSDKWALTRKGRINEQKRVSLRKTSSRNRISVTFTYKK